MSTESLPMKPSFFSYLLPNRPITILVLSGLVVEVVLLALSSHNVYQEKNGVPWMTVCLQVWLWLTFGWLLAFSVRGAARLTRAWPRGLAWPFRGVLLLIGAGLIFAYLGSWALYYRTGRFANIESVLFALENAHHGVLGQYLLQAERLMLWSVGALMMGVLVALPFLAQRIARSEWAASPRPRERALIWTFLSLSLLFPVCLQAVITRQVRMERRVMIRDQLKNRVNPVFTLAASWVERWSEAPIHPCIDEQDLTPVDAPYDPSIPKGQEPASVVFVAVESLRPDVIGLKHQGREVTPHLNRLAKNGLELTRAYSQSTHSDYADVCIVSSLYPLRARRHHYYRASDPWPKTLIYDVLKKKANYATAIISSQNEGWGGMDQFLISPHLDLFYDAERSQEVTEYHGRDVGFTFAVQSGELRAGKLVDSKTADRAVDWINDRIAERKPFFLGMNLQSSHFPYEMPEETPRPFRPCVMDFDASFLDYPKEKTAIVRNAYFNAIHNCDRQIGRLVEALEKQGRLDNTIFVVMGENGESFHEKEGFVTHAREPIESGIRVACVLHAPRYLKPRKDDYPVELIDMVPTVFGLMGWEIPPGLQGKDILSGERPPLEERLLFFHTQNPRSRADAVIQGGRWKYMQDRNTGMKHLYDLELDPNEERNLIEERPELAGRLRDVLLKWRERQLAYYHFPQYYRKYYPPPPPKWESTDTSLASKKSE